MTPVEHLRVQIQIRATIGIARPTRHTPAARPRHAPAAGHFDRISRVARYLWLCSWQKPESRRLVECHD